MLPLVVAFLGVMSSIAVDSGYVVLLPLCAAVFAAAGRHPLAGLTLGFACVSGGFSANLMVGPVDAILAGISTEAVQLVADKEVSILANYYFMLASVVLIILLTVMVNRLWVAGQGLLDYLVHYSGGLVNSNPARAGGTASCPNRQPSKGAVHGLVSGAYCVERGHSFHGLWYPKWPL